MSPNRCQGCLRTGVRDVPVSSRPGRDGVATQWLACHPRVPRVLVWPGGGGLRNVRELPVQIWRVTAIGSGINRGHRRPSAKPSATRRWNCMSAAASPAAASIGPQRIAGARAGFAGATRRAAHARRMEESSRSLRMPGRSFSVDRGGRDVSRSAHVYPRRDADRLSPAWSCDPDA